MEKKNQKGGESTMGSKVATGMGIAALAAAAAGAIYLYGTDAGKKRRTEIKTWSLRMKADVIDKMGKMKDWSEESYHEVIDTVAARYKDVKTIDKTELIALVADLKKHWKTLKSHTEPKKAPKRKPASRAKSPAKSTGTQSSETK